jgi:hypothetical protein
LEALRTQLAKRSAVGDEIIMIPLEMNALAKHPTEQCKVGPQVEQRVYGRQTSSTVWVVILTDIYQMPTEHNIIPGGACSLPRCALRLVECRERSAELS